MSPKKSSSINLRFSEEELIAAIDALEFAEDMLELLSDVTTKEYEEKYDVEEYKQRAKTCRYMLKKILNAYELVKKDSDSNDDGSLDN